MYVWLAFGALLIILCLALFFGVRQMRRMQAELVALHQMQTLACTTVEIEDAVSRAMRSTGRGNGNAGRGNGNASAAPAPMQYASAPRTDRAPSTQTATEAKYAAVRDTPEQDAPVRDAPAQGGSGRDTPAQGGSVRDTPVQGAHAN